MKDWDAQRGKHDKDRDGEIDWTIKTLTFPRTFEQKQSKVIPTKIIFATLKIPTIP